MPCVLRAVQHAVMHRRCGTPVTSYEKKAGYRFSSASIHAALRPRHMELPGHMELMAAQKQRGPASLPGLSYLSDRSGLRSQSL